RLFRQGTIDDVFSPPAELRHLGLDVPQITDIASRLIDAGVPLSGNLFTVDGVEEAILACLRGGAAS
ncbi:MAG: energy-coupling factor transporter ATPase, partial [Clostridia bacterium]|nr:energy-coupling factor transporter ATPase [Clostridia bacterium]